MGRRGARENVVFYPLIFFFSKLKSYLVSPAGYTWLMITCFVSYTKKKPQKKDSVAEEKSIHSQLFMSSFSVSSTVLNAGNTAVNKPGKIAASMERPFYWG